MGRALVIGANGQVGSELTTALRCDQGADNVVASDVKTAVDIIADGPFELLDIRDSGKLQEIIQEHTITTIYHLAAMLSANAESQPLSAWELNMLGLLNVLEAARNKQIKKVFWPSSIAAFGPNTPAVDTHQLTVMDPNTVYGISKLAGERWCEYFFHRYDVDVRSLRYPGLISFKAEPGGGTTDYAVDIYHHAVHGTPYTCYLEESTRLPMMYMEDAIRATLELMAAPSEKITIRSSYNVAGFSVTPAEMASSIQRSIPDFQIKYIPDFRQAIANSWPESIDDTEACRDWGWQPSFGLKEATATMIEHIPAKIR